MDAQELARKQTQLCKVLEAGTRLNEAVIERQERLKVRMEKLVRMHKFAPFSSQTQSNRGFYEAGTSSREAVRKAHGVVAQKVQAILSRDKSDDLTLARLLDRANASMDRYNKAATAHIEGARPVHRRSRQVSIRLDLENPWNRRSPLAERNRCQQRGTRWRLLQIEWHKAA